jgi:DNA repair protein RecN (Recombination protein N)
MLRRLNLRDFVIVPALELEFDAGFSVLTGETGAGKSILVDALQLALGGRGDSGVVREGAARAEISAEFDTPRALRDWLDESGFDANDTLLLRRSIDSQGKSRAWINGSAATVAQLREAADTLVDIHGQHAWQSLTRPPAVRALLDAQAGVDARALTERFAQWKACDRALEEAHTRSDELLRERDRLAWQIAEIERLNPGPDEWGELNAEHTRLAHAQSLLQAARIALDAVSEADASALTQINRATSSLGEVARFDIALQPLIEELLGASAQLQDAAHTLSVYLGRADLDPARLDDLDQRLSAWIGLARRFRRPPEELPVLLEQWRAELRSLEAAADLGALQRALDQSHRVWLDLAQQASAARARAAPKLANAVTQAMQGLGMAGGRFEVALPRQDKPQSFGLESVEFLIAGHAGAAPRPLAKVASGGELARTALAVAVTTYRAGDGEGLYDQAVPTLIFDEIDAGIGGAVADSVGTLLKQLGRSVQVLAVTHLAQVAACGDHHFVVSKHAAGGQVRSDVQAVHGEARVAEVARMLGGERLSGTAHAQAMLQGASAAPRSAQRRSKA